MDAKATKRWNWIVRSAAVFRWLHIYLSMVSFAALMFFAFTGLTLNHPTWFGASEQHVRDEQGELPLAILGAGLDKLAVVERLRSEHRLRGAVTEFEADEAECMIVFKGPGYSADVFVDRSAGSYTVTETTTGAMAVLNDLHKGRDSGPGWSWVIDLSAAMTMLVSLSGLGLLFYIKRRRVTGVIAAVVGTILLVVVWALAVP